MEHLVWKTSHQGQFCCIAQNDQIFQSFKAAQFIMLDLKKVLQGA